MTNRASSGQASPTADGPRPFIGLPACVEQLRNQRYHVAGEKYLMAAAVAAGGVPLTIPALGGIDDLPPLLSCLDGLLVTGSPSNVEPNRYGGSASAEETKHDPARDATTLPLIRGALDAGVPILALCRGLQELNVVLGGTLHQRVQELPGMMDHRADPEAPVVAQYAPTHPVALAPGGLLANLADGLADDKGSIMVNSLHAQGIDRLAPGLLVEARAPDGLIEAVTLADAPGFVLAVQWHPEWQVMDNPFSRRIFAAFGDAARLRARRRAGQRPGRAA